MKLIIIIFAILLLSIGNRIVEKTGCGCASGCVAFLALLAYCLLC